MNFLPHPRIVVRLLVPLALVALLAGAGAGTAAAKTPSCAKQVVADWYDDGRVGKIYPLSCYRAAIASLPTDVLDYSNAREEIGRALAYAKQGKPDPGGKGRTTTSTDTTQADTTQTETTRTDTTTDGTPTVSTPTDSLTSTDTSGPSSVPVPLIVLGGLAVLLLAAGGAGYLTRRFRSGGDDGDGTPPASA